MWRYVLLISLPPLAVALNHDIISLVISIGWTFAVIPLCIVHTLDVFRDPGCSKKARRFLRVPFFISGLISLLIGVCIVLWCLYNVFIHTLPEYSGPGSVIELALGGFGISSVMIGFGWYLMALSLGKTTGTFDG